MKKKIKGAACALSRAPQGAAKASLSSTHPGQNFVQNSKMIPKLPHWVQITANLATAATRAQGAWEPGAGPQEARQLCKAGAGSAPEEST